MRVRHVLVPVLAALTVYLAWPDRDDAAERVAGDSDPALLADRVWLDSLPEAPTQHVHAMLALSDAPLGVFQRASAYQATIELFEYLRKDGAIDLRFPQRDARRSFRFRAHACKGHEPFDLCLELDENPWGGPTRYYGFRDQDAMPAELAALRHRLEHAAVDGPAARAD